MSKSLSKATEKLISLITSDKQETVLEAIDKVREKGNADVIPALIHVLTTTSDEEIRKSISSLFTELKDQSCAEPIMTAIKNDATKGHRHILISTFWQSTIKGDAYFEDFIDLAINEDYLSCLECISVIEQITTDLGEESIAKAIIKIKNKLTVKSEKNILLFDLIEILQNRLMV